MTSRWPPLELARGAAAAAGSGSPSSPELRDGTTPVPPVAMGEIVDEKYRVDGVIGFGGMGVVCSATHLELHTSVAIKFLRPERGLNERASSRFLTEARAAAQLKSQHACRVMDCGRLADGTPYIVLEQLEGSDLRTLLDERGPLPIADAIAYAVQACEALAEAHAKHIVHRDVKPENLFLTKGPSGSACLKVLDFGISKQVGPLGSGRSITEPTENMGSPFYMSPEQMFTRSMNQRRQPVRLEPLHAFSNRSRHCRSHTLCDRDYSRRGPSWDCSRFGLWWRLQRRRRGRRRARRALAVRWHPAPSSTRHHCSSAGSMTPSSSALATGGL